jgi:hypothetical protein
MGNLGNVVFAFGGGCFYGRGVRVSGGGARFKLRKVVADLSLDKEMP